MVALLDLVGVVSPRGAVSQCREGGWGEVRLSTLFPRSEDARRGSTGLSVGQRGARVGLGRWAAEDFVGNRGQERGSGPDAVPPHTDQGRPKTVSKQQTFDSDLGPFPTHSGECRGP
ncbi:hypothetical protein DF024_12370 [Burkholderia cenocepacia]|nr:hypothetical protein DF024_12370 [Burkholderia cenocepacia]